MRVYAILDERSSPMHPLGDAIETFIRHEDAEHFVEEVRGDDPEVASFLRIEERELEAGRAELDRRCQHFAMNETRKTVRFGG